MSARLRIIRPHRFRRPQRSAAATTPIDHQSTLLALTRLTTSLMTLTEPAQMIEQMTLGLQATLGVDAVATWLLNPTSHRYILTSFASADGTNIPLEERE